MSNTGIMARLTALLLVLLLLGNKLPAQNHPEQPLKAAEAAIAKQQYAAAIESYQSVIRSGFTSADLLYNLGMAYHYEGDPGRAILYLEKAQRLSPLHKQVRQNLQTLHSQQPDQLPPLPPFFALQFWHGMGAFLQPATWAWLATVLVWAGMVLIGLRYMNRWRGRFLYSAGTLLIVLSMLCIGQSYSQQAVLANRTEAVLLHKEAALQNAPSSDSETLATLHAGLKVSVVDKKGDWIKIRLIDGRDGWMKEKTVGRI